MAFGKHVMVLLCHLLLLLLLKADSKCPKSYNCGNFSLEFPFTVSNDTDCGLITVDGCNSTEGSPTIRTRDAKSPYHILEKTSTNAFRIHDSGLQESFTPSICYTFRNMSLPETPFVSFTFSPNITFFTCYNQTASLQIQDYFQSYRSSRCNISTVYYKTPSTHQDHTLPIPQDCSSIQLPIKSGNRSADLLHLLSADFTLEWNLSEDCNKCHHGGGHCFSDNRNQFYCGTEGGLTKIVFIGGITIAALTSSLVIVFVSIRRKRAKAQQEHEKGIELFLRNNGNLAPMRYKYSIIKKMTNSFSENLGRGGFGSVYKGQFPDGRLVAVKVLNESNGNGEDFMNEVASISRTSHVNIVALLGFCFEGSKRALIYDFMPNGSLEKFIGNNASSSQESTLGWDKLFEIALGIARGLEYLHQGCRTRILHLDIKPQDILLDKELGPKISDFGLAKLCPNRSSIVSMLVARGTIGYIAPEVFSRNFGEVSYKSDVYSYGMLILEMVGGRTTVDRRDVDCTSEIYFPTYLYKQIEVNNAERDVGDGSPSVKRNMIIVGLWCIQTNPKDRPSMTRVVEMLEGKLGPLEVPPKPYLYSPPRAPPSYSTSESF
ncbi:hypothetical protein AAHA92_31942 [Salvia divinorum]|uniref:Protein kinase domain-containing protein n=1 Tax=Salvia divinorum TaxID=28513 RepID=A0ABD1FJ51_SALDI